jgi:5-methylcytosine-specific restriction endonuclease McrA
MADNQPTPDSDKSQHQPHDPNAYRRQRRAQWREAGLCTSCGHPRQPGGMKCSRCTTQTRESSQRHAEAIKERRRKRLAGEEVPQPTGPFVTADIQAYRRARRAHKRASGVCTGCGGTRDVPGKVRCSACREKERVLNHATAEKWKVRLERSNQATKAKRQEWKAQGLCTWCGNPREDPKRRRCASCYTKSTQAGKREASKRRRRIAAGFCKCGRIPRPNRRSCHRCLHRQREQYRRDYQRDPVKFLVRYHRRRIQLRQNGGDFTAAEWNAIKFAFNFTCLMCGRREPEIKLEIDHVFPVSLGGSNEASNLQTLCSSCNRSKGPKHIDLRPQVS